MSDEGGAAAAAAAMPVDKGGAQPASRHVNSAEQYVQQAGCSHALVGAPPPIDARLVELLPLDSKSVTSKRC